MEEIKNEELSQEVQPTKNGKTKWTILMIVACAVFVICAITLGVYYYKQYKAKKIYDQIQNDYVENTNPEQDGDKDKKPEVEKPKDEVTETPDQEVEPEEKDPLEKWIGLQLIDFAKLQEMNPDVYAWINVPGTKVNYPVLQHPTDDIYYLNHTIEHYNGLPGSIYSESSSEKDFSGYMHIMYGHNMKNDTMFGDLHLFRDKVFFQDHPYFFVYTPDKVFVYQVFAAVICDDSHIMYKYDFSTEEGRQIYIDDVYKNADYRNQYNSDLNITPEDLILALSTCMPAEPERRLVVNAFLVDSFDSQLLLEADENPGAEITE